ncbi:MAG: ABC transporter permease [Clostridia bacterium]|nr:ABC transporter permease [Clostridia bacterium]
MNLYECLKSSVRNVFSNKMRTFLTMLGIIIGISSVIIIVAIGNGSQAAIEKEFDTFGTGTLKVSLVSSKNIDTRDLLTMDDYYMLKDDVDGIKYIAPTYSGSNSAYVKLLDPTQTNKASITGSTGDYKFINNDTLLYGRYISDNDVEMRNNVCVIQDTTAQKVFDECDDDVIGQKIKIESWKGTTKLTVVGITENTDTSSSEYSSEYPEEIVMPITTCMKVFTGSTLSGLSIIIDNPEQSEAMQTKILSALSNFHDNSDKYYIEDSTDIVDSINSILSYVTIFISFVAAISLLVGGIGVMNIMMVTVTERTKEIGIRKAIGAKNKDILLQFISEAIILTGMGGLLGLIFGWFGALIVGKIVDITPIMSISAIVGAIGISTAIGIIFGVTPAKKAAALDPIEALRFE